jgi:hypothetical protein
MRSGQVSEDLKDQQLSSSMSKNMPPVEMFLLMLEAPDQRN